MISILQQVICIISILQQVICIISIKAYMVNPDIPLMNLDLSNGIGPSSILK